jgi:hypothetical protein
MQRAANSSIRNGADSLRPVWIRTAIFFGGGRMYDTGMRIFFGLLTAIYTNRN